MNKKLIALAIATAFAAPVAMADSGNVKISGQLNLSFDSIKGYAGGEDNQTMSNVSSNSSNIVFSGDEDLGNGLKAIWQMQTYTSMGGTGNTDAVNADGIGNGNSFLGLTGGFGKVQLGKFDTPFKTLGRKADLFGNQIGDSRNLISAGGNAGTWDLRPSSTVAYTTPDMGGFQAAAAYSTNNTTTANTMAATSAASVGATYANGPVFVGLSYERHNVANASGMGQPALTTRDTAPSAWRLAGGFDFGVAKVVALYQRTKDNNGTSGAGVAAANTADDDRNTWGLGASFKMGSSNTLKAQYYRAGDFGGMSDTGANMWALGFDHAMSKRTTAYVALARTANDTAASYSVSGGGHGDNAGSNAGENTNALSVGMIHNF